MSTTRKSLSCVMNAHHQCTGAIPGSGVTCTCSCHHPSPTMNPDMEVRVVRFFTAHPHLLNEITTPAEAVSATIRWEQTTTQGAPK